MNRSHIIFIYCDLHHAFGACGRICHSDPVCCLALFQGQRGADGFRSHHAIALGCIIRIDIPREAFLVCCGCIIREGSGRICEGAGFQCLVNAVDFLLLVLCQRLGVGNRDLDLGYGPRLLVLERFLQFLEVRIHIGAVQFLFLYVDQTVVVQVVVARKAIGGQFRGNGFLVFIRTLSPDILVNGFLHFFRFLLQVRRGLHRLGNHGIFIQIVKQLSVKGRSLVIQLVGSDVAFCKGSNHVLAVCLTARDVVPVCVVNKIAGGTCQGHNDHDHEPVRSDPIRHSCPPCVFNC